MQIKIEELAVLLKGKIINKKDIFINNISTDSRTLREGDCFFAICGERYDGHDFVKEAEKKGACCCVVERDIRLNIPTIVVKDTKLSLLKLASWWRKRFKIPIISVSGSNGKTSTVNFIKELLSLDYKVCASPKSYNNIIGLSLSLLSLKETDDIGVFELGTSGFGELKKLSAACSPDVAVITSINEEHTLFLKDIDGVIEAEGEIFYGLKEGGICIINGDCEHTQRLLKKAKNFKLITFGEDKKNDFYARIQKLSPLSFDVFYKGKIYIEGVEGNLLGRCNVYNILGALVVCWLFKLNPKRLKEKIKEIRPQRGRLFLIQKDDFKIIDDTYNSNPASLKEALDVLDEFDGKKILILADMLELSSPQQKHFQMGEYIKNKKVDILMTYGDFSFYFTKGAGFGQHFKEKQKLIMNLKKISLKNSIILIKGSRAMGMEEVVQFLSSL